jgi:hypothetical protein
VTHYLLFVTRSRDSWQYPGRWTHVPSLQVTVGPRGWGFVAVTTGTMDTCSTSPGFPRPTIDWEEQVSVAVRHRIEDLSKTALTRLRLGGLNKVRQADAFRRPHSGRTLAPIWAPNRWPPTL